MKTVLIGTCLALALTGAKAADSTLTPIALVGAGTVGCGKYIALRRANAAPQLNEYVQWVDGYFSAYNGRGFFLASYQNLKQVTLPDRETVLLYLEKHCTDHPLDNIASASLRMLSDMGADLAK